MTRQGLLLFFGGGSDTHVYGYVHCSIDNIDYVTIIDTVDYVNVYNIYDCSTPYALFVVSVPLYRCRTK